VSDTEGPPALRPETLPVGLERARERPGGRKRKNPLTSPCEPGPPTHGALTGRTWLTSPAGAERERRVALPVSPARLGAYLTYLARHGAKVPTMS
jgi:hypothetical protein